jgi:hypothetical protein
VKEGALESGLRDKNMLLSARNISSPALLKKSGLDVDTTPSSLLKSWNLIKVDKTSSNLSADADVVHQRKPAHKSMRQPKRESSRTLEIWNLIDVDNWLASNLSSADVVRQRKPAHNKRGLKKKIESLLDDEYDRESFACSAASLFTNCESPVVAASSSSQASIFNQTASLVRLNKPRHSTSFTSLTTSTLDQAAKDRKKHGIGDGGSLSDNFSNMSTRPSSIASLTSLAGSFTF